MLRRDNSDRFGRYESLFVIGKKECRERRVVGAYDYDNLVKKATTDFEMNPNNAKLTYEDPRYGSIILDSQEIYEYVEERNKEIMQNDKESNLCEYKPFLLLSGNEL